MATVNSTTRCLKILLRHSKKWSDDQILSAMRAAVVDWNYFPPETAYSLESFLEKESACVVWWGALLRLANGLDGLEEVYANSHERWAESPGIKLQRTRIVRGLKTPNKEE